MGAAPNRCRPGAGRVRPNVRRGRCNARGPRARAARRGQARLRSVRWRCRRPTRRCAPRRPTSAMCRTSPPNLFRMCGMACLHTIHRYASYCMAYNILAWAAHLSSSSSYLSLIKLDRRARTCGGCRYARGCAAGVGKAPNPCTHGPFGAVGGCAGGGAAGVGNENPCAHGSAGPFGSMGGCAGGGAAGVGDENPCAHGSAGPFGSMGGCAGGGAAGVGDENPCAHGSAGPLGSMGGCEAGSGPKVGVAPMTPGAGPCEAAGRPKARLTAALPPPKSPPGRVPTLLLRARGMRDGRRAAVPRTKPLTCMVVRLWLCGTRVNDVSESRKHGRAKRRSLSEVCASQHARSSLRESKTNTWPQNGVAEGGG